MDHYIAVNIIMHVLVFFCLFIFNPDGQSFFTGAMLLIVLYGLFSLIMNIVNNAPLWIPMEMIVMSVSYLIFTDYLRHRGDFSIYKCYRRYTIIAAGRARYAILIFFISFVFLTWMQFRRWEITVICLMTALVLSSVLMRGSHNAPGRSSRSM